MPLTDEHKQALAWAAYVVEELADLYAAAREDGADQLPTKVGANFEQRVGVALAALRASDVQSEPPPLP